MMVDKEFEARIKKLPKWAQMYIGKLRRDVDSLTEDAVATGTTPIWWEDLAVRDKRYYLPEYARIVFELPEGRMVAVVVKDRLQIIAPAGRPAVVPKATSSIAIHVEDW